MGQSSFSKGIGSTKSDREPPERRNGQMCPSLEAGPAAWTSDACPVRALRANFASSLSLIANSTGSPGRPETLGNLSGGSPVDQFQHDEDISPKPEETGGRWGCLYAAGASSGTPSPWQKRRRARSSQRSIRRRRCGGQASASPRASHGRACPLTPGPYPSRRPCRKSRTRSPAARRRPAPAELPRESRP
jgi:hypothetical protein